MQYWDFEEAFGNFLEREEYDEASNAIYRLTRAAFLAGYKAAGGEVPKPIVWLLKKDEQAPTDEPTTTE